MPAGRSFGICHVLSGTDAEELGIQRKELVHMRKIRGSSLTWAVIATALVGWVVQAGAASTTPSADEKSFIALKGSRSVLASVALDKGRASEETILRHLRIVLSRSAEQQAQLDQFEAELLEHGSANFKKWLTPEQFGSLYGPADSEIQAIVAWLHSNGFTV